MSIPSEYIVDGGYVNSQVVSSVHSGTSCWLEGISCHTLALGFRPAPFVVTCIHVKYVEYDDPLYT